jgi:hypothetical protein
MSFAQGTVVPVEKSRAEIEKLITKYGASGFSSGWMGTRAALQFVASGRNIRFILELPDQEWARDHVMKTKRPRWYYRENIPTSHLAPLVEAENRRRWRCLLLAIKAKLEVVESGIATFDEEFLAHIVIEDRTVFDRIREASGGGRPLLPPIHAEK